MLSNIVTSTTLIHLLLIRISRYGFFFEGGPNTHTHKKASAGLKEYNSIEEVNPKIFEIFLNIVIFLIAAAAAAVSITEAIIINSTIYITYYVGYLSCCCCLPASSTKQEKEIRMPFPVEILTCEKLSAIKINFGHTNQMHFLGRFIFRLIVPTLKATLHRSTVGP